MDKIIEFDNNSFVQEIEEIQPVENPIMTEREFCFLIEGRDEDGNSKAMVSVSVLMPDDNDDPEGVSIATSVSGAVYMAIIPDGLSMIDVMFESNIEYDFLQIGGVCEEFFDTAQSANLNGTIIPTLVLSVAPQGDFMNVMTAVDCVWSYIPTTVNQVCTGIRFIVKTDNINFVQLTEEQANLIFEELEDEEKLHDAIFNETANINNSNVF